MKDKDKDKGLILIYIPAGSRINTSNRNEDSPIVEYEERKKIIDITQAKKLCGGVYGRSKNFR